MRKAFTLIELIVAIGILAVVISFAGLIFRVSIASHRTALANAEIMQKLRVITEQLDTDFKSGLFEYGGRVQAHTRTYEIDGNDVEVNSDCVAFLANGDFQTTNQYAGETVVGNVAAIFYGSPDPNSYDRLPDPQDRVLLRRQTILAPTAPPSGSDPNGEYYGTSLQQWWAGTPVSDFQGWIKHPLIDPNNLKAYLPMYVAKGVDDFTISYLERGDVVGIDAIEWTRRVEGEDPNAPTGIDPRAFKFTFTLYDWRGIIKGGRTFTHIVLLNRVDL